METQFYIWVRIWHGYLRKASGKHHPKELGGLFGGHVVLQIEGHCYGFFYLNRKKIHVLPQAKNLSCEFQKQSLCEWEEIVADKKETSIRIPVNQTDYDQIRAFYKQALQQAPYDYAMLGQRCASSVYDLLKDLKIITGPHYYLAAFYPAALRRTLLKHARKQNWKVVVKQGSTDRIWA